MTSIFCGLFAKLTGGEASDEAAKGKSEEYRGYLITPAPKREGSQWLTAGIISKVEEGAQREQHFVRADRHSSREEADRFAVSKAKQIIDEQGDSLFSDRA